MSTSFNIARLTAIILSFLFAYLGIAGWWNQWGYCNTWGREIQTASQLVYGSCGALLGIYSLVNKPVPTVVKWIWTLSTVIAAGMAPVVWGEAGLFAGIASGFMGLLIALGAIWLSRRGRRALTSGSS